MAAHRYWRIGLTASVVGTTYHIIEIEMRTSAGGADQCTGGTATASNTTAGFSPANAFDDDGVSSWHRSSASAQWIKYDFGAGNDKDIVEVAITCGTVVDRAPKNFTIEWSDDNSAWTTLVTLTSITSWYPGERKLFNSSGETSAPSIASSCDFWRLVVTARDGSATLLITEMEMRASSGGADQTGSGTPYEGGVPSIAGDNFLDLFDNAAGTWWQVGGLPHATRGHPWGGYDFGTAKAITEIALSSGTDPTMAPKDFYLQRSEDGVGWAAAGISLTGVTGWTASQTRYFDATGEVSGAPPSSSARPVVFVST